MHRIRHVVIPPVICQPGSFRFPDLSLYDLPASMHGPAYLNYTRFCQLIDQLPGFSDLRLQGNAEPLQHLHFFQMVRYAVARGFRVSTCTGLTILPEYRVDECINSGLHTVHVALDAACAPSYAALHGKDRFGKILRNLRRLMAARSRQLQARPHMHLLCTVMRRNLSDLPRLVQLAHEEGFSHMTVRHLDDRAQVSSRQVPALYHYAGETGLLQDDRQRVAFYFDLARRRARKLHINLHLPKIPALLRAVQAAPGCRRILQRAQHFFQHPENGATPGSFFPALVLPQRDGAATTSAALAARGVRQLIQQNATSAGITEVCQADAGRSGTY